MKVRMKWLLSLLILLLCISFTACGNKKEEEDPNEYSATFTQTKISLKNAYLNGASIRNGVFWGLEDDYNADYTKVTERIHAVDLATGEDKTVELTGYDFANGSRYISCFAPGADGKFYVVAAEWKDDGQNSYYCMIYSQEGLFEKEVSLDNALEGSGYLGSDCFIVTPDGKFVFASDSKLICTDSSGKKLASTTAGYYIRSLSQGNDGELFCYYYSDGGSAIGRYDVAKDEIVDSVEIGSGADNAFIDNGKVYVLTSTSIRETDIATGESKMLWGWLDIDVDSDRVLDIKANDDGSYKVITTRNDENSYVVETAKVTYGPRSANSKEKLVMGCVYLDSEVKEAIRNFNRTNDKYRITVKAYIDEFPDYEEANKKFNMDLASNTKLDIISMDSYDFMQYVDSKGLADITSDFEKDFNRDDYFSAVLDALSRDGKLYGISPSFSLSTMLVSKDTAAGRTSWNINDIMELRKNNLDKTFFEGGDKETALIYMLYYSLGDFVDFKNAKCSFDSDAFKALLEFASTFPDSFNYDDFDSWKAISDGDVLVATASIYDVEFSNLVLYEKLFNDDVVLIGFPTDSETGNQISPGTIYSIASKSKHKDGAWEFIKEFLKDDYQRNQWNLPLSRKVFSEKANEILSENSDSSYGTSAIGNGFTTVELDRPTQKELDLVLDALDKAGMSNTYDEELFKIIREEAQPFFKGQKSADEISKVIQSRVELYLQEKN